MTTTLRPTEPLQHAADGTRSRHYQVCVNSRPVGGIRLTTLPGDRPSAARVEDLRIDEPERGRGRGAVAALAAEEVLRGWGCRRVEVSVPPDAEAALRLVTALGYSPLSRDLAKRLGGPPPGLPDGSAARPMTRAEYGPWLERQREESARSLIRVGIPAAEAHTRSDESLSMYLADGLATKNTLISVLEHEGTPVGVLWLGLWSETARVLGVEVQAEHRGRGHGRALMLLAEKQAAAGGRDRVGLTVFAGNTPAERLHQSSGYRTTEHHFHKQLL
jgi:GNAT superfamily N-acetyltransferase